MNKYLLGLDVGGTKVEAAILNISDEFSSKKCIPIPSGYLSNTQKLWGTIIDRERILTERNRGYEPVMDSISKLISDICSKNKITLNQLYGIGVGMPGTIHPKKQYMLNGNSQIFIEKPFSEDLKKRLNLTECNILLENDASCFALAEVMCGVGHDYLTSTGKQITDQIGVGIILGTGVGGGIVIKGKVLSGKIGGGGEIGHTTLYPNGRPCYCGEFGCVEQYLAGSSLEKIYFEKYNESKKSVDIFSDFESDKRSNELIQNYQDNLIIFLRNLASVFDPDYFVLGGGVSTQEILYIESENLLNKRVFVPNSCPKIYKHKLGDSAGVIGAAILPLTI